MIEAVAVPAGTYRLGLLLVTASAVNWLKTFQREDGGWGETCSTCAVIPTWL